jgi:hypothetical protein
METITLDKSSPKYRKAYCKVWREKNKQHLAEYRKKWALANPEKKYGYEKKWRAKHPENRIIEKRLERLRHPDREAAHHAVQFSGEVQHWYCCMICGATEKPLEEHHPDYSKPLETFTLCHDCHKIADKERRKGEKMEK